MKMQNIARFAVLAAIAAFAANALAVDEVEKNDTVYSAQQVKSYGGAVDINAMMGSAANPLADDTDFYQISAKAGDVLTLDIDNGYKSSAPLNTVIAVFGEGPTFPLLRMNDDAPQDAGSASPMDARIDNWVVPKDGIYTVGVSQFPFYFYTGGRVSPMVPFSNKVVTDYKLSIHGVSDVSVKKIDIEVKPGSDSLAPLNPRSNGKIPVAILGSLTFSATSVDTSSLTFGSTGNEQSLSKCAKSGDDVNGDGYYDLVCHFNNQAAGFKRGDLEGILKGKTNAGKAFEGRAPLKVIPGK